MTINQNAIGADFATATDVPLFALGTRVRGSGDEEWIYVHASGAIASAGQVVVIDEDFEAALLSTSNDAAGDRVGVVGGAFTDNYYGWAQIYGVASIQVGANCAANVGINTTGTAGQLDDDGTGGSFDISGMILTTARGGTAGTAPGVLNYPAMAMAAN